MFQFKKDTIYITLAILGFIILSLILFFVWPLFLSIKNNSSALLSGKNDAEILRSQSDQIENFKKVYDNYKPDLEKINQLFIDPKNPVTFIEFLENSATTSFIDLEVSLISDQKEPSTVIFQLSTTGNFTHILDFSKKIENGPYLIQIKNISMKSADTEAITQGNPSGKVDANLLISAFIKP